ncbi:MULTISPECIES: aminotransferase class I/II-fold pyridoxal phosphate-dependent enzyme [unclassified Streptomyces]|uniref:aminotransferase class I/II-fold pyridoxal phosphate-dependent enzyme n=1 Tax=unclassified Streptomyces TaxID=2593676 RepID=UPI00081F1598|nr:MULTISPECIES: aminotransferase class I/II-fold pyridoxal phosphate-dependent enzyme [unclassified Streptomyces]MYZ38137.1 aminotransferase class I/II-fold pyridoxal phosphate-dependent enzyme [Streptomyces sp. SID4917]SCF96545.1 Histidinol-phosphate/aromatic aminotransferase or cobyric acid decarboxylase [Streptomyces sp. MnatMP-M17]
MRPDAAEPAPDYDRLLEWIRLSRNDGHSAPRPTLLAEVLQNRLDVCANPLGPPESALLALVLYAVNCSAELVPPPYERDRPPYTGHRMYLEAYARHLGAEALADNMIAGQGVSGFLVILSHLLRDKRTAVPTPEYTGTLEYFSYAHFVEPRKGVRDTAGYRLERIQSAMKENEFVVFSNPNNPLGHYIDRADLEEVCRENPDSTLIVDEEYIEFEGENLSLIGSDLENLVVLQSTGKSYGITGTRAGIMWSRNREICQKAEERLAKKWPLSILDAVLATAALNDESWLRETMHRIDQNARLLEEILVEYFGDDVAPGASIHYRFVWLDATAGTPDRIARHMRAHGIEVRAFDGKLRGSQPGIRLRAPCNDEEFSRLTRALKSWRSQTAEGTPHQPRGEARQW